MASSNSVSEVRAAGGVLWEPGPGGVRVALVFRPDCDNWSLPKGKLGPGEHPLAGACREVEEETGVAGIPGPYLTASSYTLPNPAGDVHKTVSYWAMRAAAPRGAFVPNDEIAECRWVTLAEARRLCSRPRDFAALDAFAALPPITGIVVLLRHAKAAADFDGPDVSRPLTTKGTAQVGHLMPLLTLFRPGRVFAASPLRCVRTVTPLAEVVRVPVEGDSAFDADGHFRNPERAASRLIELAKGTVDEPATTAVVCSQLPVIADTLALLADTGGIALPSVHTPPAGVWVLAFSGADLAAAQRL